MNQLKKEFNSVLDGVLQVIKEDGETYSPLGNSIQRIFNDKYSIQDIYTILESLSMCEESLSYDEDDFFIMDYDALLAYVGMKPRAEQVQIIKTIRTYLSQYFIWETNKHHCLISFETKENTNNGEVA